MQQQIRNWIVDQLNTVPNIGAVHGYQRYVDREKQLADLYHHDGRLHGWFVRRVSVKETVETGRSNKEESVWLIHGYLAINDATASELEFDELLEAVRQVFSVTDIEFVKIADQLVQFAGEKHIGFAVLDSQPVLFSGVLCHSAVCQLMTTRLILEKR